MHYSLIVRKDATFSVTSASINLASFKRRRTGCGAGAQPVRLAIAVSRQVETALCLSTAQR